jgi:hypothetical protein
MSGEEAGESGEKETITLKLRSSGREEMLFKVKKTTKMQKIMDSYASRIGVGTNTLRFVFDGQKVDGETTPKMLVSLSETRILLLLSYPVSSLVSSKLISVT